MSLYDGFRRSALADPSAPALVIQDQYFTYGQLDGLAGAVAAALEGACEGEARVGVLVHRDDVYTYAAALAVASLGATYVPVPRDVSIDRLRSIVDTAGLTILTGHAADLRHVATSSDLAVRFIASDQDPPRHRRQNSIPPRRDDQVAYIVHTSGSTGVPKGVPITEANLTKFLSSIRPLLAIRPDDVVAQLVSPAFDLSILSIFGAWDAGACVAPLSPKDLALSPVTCLSRIGVTVWISVPSTLSLLAVANRLTERSLPGVRLTVVCGEPLLESTASWWSRVAPATALFNTYGPSEATVACTYFRWRATGHEVPSTGFVPIGVPFDGIDLQLLDRKGMPANPGEIHLAGPQIFSGYLASVGDEWVHTRVSDTDGHPYYRTGDRAWRDERGVLHFLGRDDRQVKILGHRLELGEVESEIRAAASTPLVCVVKLQDERHPGGRLAALLADSRVSCPTLLAILSAQLPSYAVPQIIMEVGSLPMTANGKVDTEAVTKILARGR